MRFESGAVFAGYSILSRLGRGGMATVYLVREPGLDRMVALKVLPEQLVDEEQFAARFEQEARLIGSLDHPNIIPLYRYGITDDVPWMALRYVDGGDLASRLKARPLPLAEGLSILHGVAAALDYAHRRGVIHRDLKPQNILLTGEGAVYLADFGVAKMLEGANGANTAAGDVLGSPSYMAPEQAQGLRLGPYTDVYALAVMCFQWLTGSLPFDADTPHAILLKHIREPLPTHALDLLAPNVAAVLQRGLAKQPGERFQAASALIAALEQALHAPSIAVVGAATQALPPVPTPPARQPERSHDDLPAPRAPAWTRRRKAAVWMSLGLALAIGGYVGREAMRAASENRMLADHGGSHQEPASVQPGAASSGMHAWSVRLGCLSESGSETTDSTQMPFWNPKDNGGKPLCVLNRVYLTASDIETYSVEQPDSGQPALLLAFNPDGARRMTALTSANMDRQLVYVLDGKILVAAKIMSPVGRFAQVTGIEPTQIQTIAGRMAQVINQR